MQNQNPTPCTLTIYPELYKGYASGLAGLLANAHLLAIANTYSTEVKIDKSSVNMLQAHIQTASETLNQAMTALAFALFDLENDNASADVLANYITPSLVAEFSVLVSELLPVFTQLADNLNTNLNPNR